MVLESKDLDKLTIGNVIRIAPADRIKAGPREAAFLQEDQGAAGTSHHLCDYR